MAFQKVEYEFPEGEDEDKIELEPSSAKQLGEVEVEVEEDDTEIEAEKAPAKKKEEEDDLEIEIVDDTPAADRNRKPSKPPEEVTDEELEEYSDKVRNRIKHFSKGYHDERRAKEAALRERQELEAYAKKLMEENQTLKGTVDKSQGVMLEQAKKAVAAELEAAKAKYREAYEAGDTEGVIEAQDALTTAKLRAERVNNYKPPLQPPETPVKPLPQEEQRAAPVPVDTRAQDWAAENTWFNNDDEMTSVALGYHSKLVKDGVNPQSDEYYDAINARMRKLFPERFEDDGPEVTPQQRQRSANVVAPATRSVAPKKVTLTRTQVSLAKRLGVPLDVYAKQVAEDMRKQKNG